MNQGFVRYALLQVSSSRVRHNLFSPFFRRAHHDADSHVRRKTFQERCRLRVIHGGHVRHKRGDERSIAHSFAGFGLNI